MKLKKSIRLIEIEMNETSLGTKTKVKVEGCMIRCPGCGSEVRDDVHSCLRPTKKGGR